MGNRDTSSETLHAVLRSAERPSWPQEERMIAFLEHKYGQLVTLDWVEDPALRDGFLLKVGLDTYDWSVEGRLRQFKDAMDRLEHGEQEEDIIPPHPRDGARLEAARGCGGDGPGAHRRRRHRHRQRSERGDVR